jgi:hypothetical protein
MAIGYCIKKADFGDDHVFQDEILPKVYYDPEDPTIGKSNGSDTSLKLHHGSMKHLSVHKVTPDRKVGVYLIRNFEIKFGFNLCPSLCSKFDPNLHNSNSGI